MYRHKHHKRNPVKFSEGSSLLSSKPNISKDGVEVKTINFCNFLHSIDHVKILKIDIEGFEVKVIPHLVKNNALKNVDNIFLELHDHKWPELRTETKNLLSLLNEKKLLGKFHLDWP